MSFSEKFKYTESAVTMSDAAGSDNVNAYRSVSAPAVASFVFGLLSAVCIVYRELFVFVVPVLAIVLARIAAKQIRRNPEVLTGRGLLTVGTITAVAFTILSGAMYLHDRNRIPPEYRAISFDELQPTEVERASGQPVPEQARILSDRQVYVLGYMSPGKGTVVNAFTLNSAQPDGCGHCAVDTSDTHHIFVRMKDPGRTATFTTRQMAVGGRLMVNDPPIMNSDGSLKIYEIEADFVR